MNWGMKMTEHRDKRSDNHSDNRSGMSDAGLDALFEAAKRDAPQPDAALLARVMADARATQRGFEAGGFEAAGIGPVPERSARAAEPRGGFLEGLFDMIGGWGGLGGLATASAFGLWLGMSQSLGLVDSFGLANFGAAANLESLGAEYDYLAGLGEV